MSDSKRVASSPPGVQDDKKLCLSDSMESDDFSDQTILHSLAGDFLSSTLAETPRSSKTTYASATALKSSSTKASFLSPEIRNALHDELKALLCDPYILDMQSKALAAELRTEINSLKRQLQERDEVIIKLNDRVDELEQYGRQNSVRITGIPESSNEDTDKLVMALVSAVGAEIKLGIDRSHRVGVKKDGVPRPVIAKFIAYGDKRALITSRTKLAKIGGDKIFPNLAWPLPPVGWSGPKPFSHRVFINDDLTKTRAEAVGRARALKTSGKIKDVWDLNGKIFIKTKDDKVHIITKRADLAKFGDLAIVEGQRAQKSATK